MTDTHRFGLVVAGPLPGEILRRFEVVDDGGLLVRLDGCGQEEVLAAIRALRDADVAVHRVVALPTAPGSPADRIATALNAMAKPAFRRVLVTGPAHFEQSEVGRGVALLAVVDDATGRWSGTYATVLTLSGVDEGWRSRMYDRLERRLRMQIAEGRLT